MAESPVVLTKEWAASFAADARKKYIADAIPFRMLNAIAAGAVICKPAEQERQDQAELETLRCDLLELEATVEGLLHWFGSPKRDEWSSEDAYKGACDMDRMANETLQRMRNRTPDKLSDGLPPHVRA